MYYIEESEGTLHEKHRNYRIRKGDTLQSVARELGTDALELRRYHNIYCEIPDLIEADFKSHLDFLILAPENKKGDINEQKNKKANKVSLGSNYKLPFLPENINNNYKVEYTIEVGEEINVIEIKTSVKWLAVDKNKYHLFEIDREKDIYINGKLPDTMMDGLATKTAEVLYPLKIVIDEYGEWIDIYNYDEIESRWGKVKNEILDYYEGEVVEAYIEHTEYALKNQETLLSSLRSDYFLRAFFNGIHVNYTADYCFKNKVSFPLEKEEESIFEVQQKIEPYLDDFDFIKVEQKGHYLDSGYGFMYNYTPSKVNYNAVYFLNSDTYTIEKINLECNIKNHEPKKITIVIELFKDKKK